MRYTTKLLAATALAATVGGTALAQKSVGDFYKGKRLRIIVSSTPGGGYDAYTRLLARHMVNHIPGKPSAIVQNMPGGGGVTAANFLYNVAPKDGTVFANIQRTVPFLPVFGHKGPKFDPVKFNWLGSLNNEVTVCIAKKAAQVKTFADLQKTQLIVGGSGPNDTETVPSILNNLLGAKFKIIAGYPSSTAVYLAMDRGEVQGICSSYGSLRAHSAKWLAGTNILIQSSTRKHTDLANVPLALDLAKSPADRAVLELNDARLEIGRPFVAPPNLPAERVAILRNAFDAMVKDKAFIADAKRQGRDLNPVSGKDVQALISRVAKADKTIIAKLKDSLVFKGVKGRAKINILSVSGEVSEIKRGGRSISLKIAGGKKFKLKVSGSKTRLSVAGKKAKRKAVKVGMMCSVKSPSSGETALELACK